MILWVTFLDNISHCVKLGRVGVRSTVRWGYHHTAHERIGVTQHLFSSTLLTFLRLQRVGVDMHFSECHSSLSIDLIPSRIPGRFQAI